MTAIVLFAGSTHCPPGKEIRAATFVSADGPIALLVESGGGWHRLNVNLGSEVVLAADEVAIRDYGPGEGTLASLVGSGIVAPPHRTVNNGHRDFPICRLLVSPRPLDEDA